MALPPTPPLPSSAQEAFGILLGWRVEPRPSCSPLDGVDPLAASAAAAVTPHHHRDAKVAEVRNALLIDQDVGGLHLRVGEHT